MLYHAKNCTVSIGNTDMNYITFGNGPKTLVMIPGLGDGLKTVKGMALPFAYLYRAFAKDYRVFVFSRKNEMPQNYSLHDMAEDQVAVMKALGLSDVCLLGISMGGMIAQHIALNHPEMIKKLVLAVTAAQQNETLQTVVCRWIAMAERADYKSLVIDTAKRSYSEAYIKKHSAFLPLLGIVGKPKDFSRFLIQANACLGHNVATRLPEINCPTLVVGGDRDHVVGTAASTEISNKIPGSKLVLYNGLGHMAYEEAPDFNQQVLAFLDD